MQWVAYVLEGGLLLVLAVGFTCRLIREHSGKPSAAEAELIEKPEEPYRPFSVFGKLGPSVREQYTLTFRSKGKICKFSADRLLYDLAAEGQKVKITYKGGRLIGIEPR